MNNVFYKIIDGDTFDFDISGKRISEPCDWSAIYLQTSYERAMCYLSHKAYLSKSNKLIMVKFTLLTDYHIFDNPIMGQSDIDCTTKATILKHHFGITSMLMDSLDKPLLIFDDPTNYELVVPHHLWNSNTFTAEIIADTKQLISNAGLYELPRDMLSPAPPGFSSGVRSRD
jgi:hypothetical protein